MNGKISKTDSVQHNQQLKKPICDTKIARYVEKISATTMFDEPDLSELVIKKATENQHCTKRNEDENLVRINGEKRTRSLVLPLKKMLGLNNAEDLKKLLAESSHLEPSTRSDEEKQVIVPAKNGKDNNGSLNCLQRSDYGLEPDSDEFAAFKYASNSASPRLGKRHNQNGFVIDAKRQRFSERGGQPGISTDDRRGRQTERVNVTNIKRMAENPKLVYEATELKRTVNESLHPCIRILRLLEAAVMYALAAVRVCKSRINAGDSEYVDSTIKFITDLLIYTDVQHPEYCGDDRLAVHCKYLINLCITAVSERRYLCSLCHIEELQRIHKESLQCGVQAEREIQAMNDYITISAYHMMAQKCLLISRSLAMENHDVHDFQRQIERCFGSFEISKDIYCIFAYILLGIRKLQSRR
ncbi:hypothetical protein ACOME3_005347 [Neoechinorhynchus agilis]